MTRFIFLMISLLSFNFIHAQLTNKGNLYISNGTTVYLSGIDFINDNGTTYTYKNEGNFIFAGDNFVNNGTMAQTTIGSTTFSGNNPQNIKGTQPAYFNNLIINNANNSVTQVENDVFTNDMNVNDGAADFDYKVNDGYLLNVNNNISTNGDIRLIGESQLIQTHTGTSLASGSKYLWLDQQGTTNQYYYNYWSAPVNRSGSWKVPYLKDGAQGDNINKSSYPDIQVVNNTNATNDLPAQSHPVALNAYWFFAFKDGVDGSYQGWYDNHIQSTGTVNPAEGYTMKGPGVDAALNAANGAATTDYASWTFAGVPNDGDYTINITEGHDYLIGNPYPSALDANAFINANVGGGTDKFNGTLYFWEHTGGNDHFGANYQGGYAIYNLSGGTPATDWQTGTTTVGTKTPKQYIPVGQGFFIWAETGQGGTVTFNNSMRAFVKESGGNSVFIRPASQTDIRLGFDMQNGEYHRQILLAVRPNTTNGIDWGWDGPNFDADFPTSDMRWNINDRDFIIQAIPNLDRNSRIPLHVMANNDDVVSFNIDQVENLPAGINEIYIEDTSDNTSHRIDNGNTFDLYLQAGDYKDRFYLTFQPTSTSTVEETQLENIVTYLDNNSDELVILNPKAIELSTIRLFALTGQEIYNKTLNTNKTQIRIPVKLTTGVYLVNIQSVDGKVSSTKVIKK